MCLTSFVASRLLTKGCDGFFCKALSAICNAAASVFAHVLHVA